MVKKYNNWLDTEHAKRIRLSLLMRKRILFHAETEPKSKGGISSAERTRFHRDLEAAMSGRPGYPRARVALSLMFYGTKDNPPSIDKLAKNYIDLLYRVPQGATALFTDDQQIDYLSVSSTQKIPEGTSARESLKGPSAPELLERPSIHGEAQRMSVFMEKVRWAHSSLKREKELDVDTWFLDDVDEEWRENRNLYVQLVGEATYDAIVRLNMIQKQGRQLRDLERLLHSSLLTALGNQQPLRRRPLRDEMLLKYFSCELPSIPQVRGSGKAFDLAVESALKDFRTKWPSLFPLYVPLAVFGLLVPPKNGDIDLDNLAQRLIPAVTRELRPPRSHDFLVDLSNITDLKMKAELEARAANARRMSPTHVARFEFLRLKRTDSDPDKGSLRIALADGNGRSFVEYISQLLENDDGHF